MVWKEAKDGKGRVYYYDTVTRQTSWTLPEEKVVEKQPVAAKKKPHEDETVKEKEKEKKSSNEVLSEAQAKERFSAMLKDHGVDIQWSFDRVMDELATTDPRYWFGDFNNDEDPNHQWDDPLWKQTVWQDYIWSQQSQRLEDHISSFQSLLQQKYNDGNLKLWHPWPYASKHILNMDTDYSFVILDEELQRKLYYQYIDDLRNSKQQSEEASKQQAKQEMTLYLKSIINSSSGSRPLPWDRILSEYLSSDNKRYVANKNFQLLTLEDILLIYIELLNEYEMKIDEQLRDVKESNYTRDRYARDQFKAWLRGELEPKLEIKFNSTWNRDIYPQIKNDDKFLALVGRNGSSPLDLFHDRLHELITILKTKSSLVQEILIEKGVDVSQLNKKQLCSIIEEHANITDGLDDVGELAEFIFQQQHSQQLQQYNTTLTHLIRTHAINSKLPTWEFIQTHITQRYNNKFTLVSEKEMHDCYKTLCQRFNIRETGANLSKKRPLTHVDLDY